MKRLLILLGLAAVACAAGLERPNVILIFCDDLGYGDLGCFGSEQIRTPNIDRLANPGIRYTSFYSTSGVCTPSRSSLMTGCYPRRVGLHEDENSLCVLFPNGRKGLNPDETTIAEMLQAAGYATLCVGKWHLGDQPEFLPTRHGFDHYFGIPYSNDMGERKDGSRPPLPLLRDETVIEAPAVQNTLTARYTEEVNRFIREQKDNNFFIYLPHTFPHLPLHPGEAFVGKSAIGKYGDVVEEIDASTGEILKTLEETGLAQDTLVIFTSDNGSNARNGGSNGPLRGRKGETWEGGHRVPCIVHWPAKLRRKRDCREVATTMDWLPTLAYLCRAELPERAIDGRNIWGLLQSGSARSPHKYIAYYQMGQLQCIRSDKWKLHLPLEVKQKNWGRPDGGAPLALYDLEADLGEKADVAADFPRVVARLQKYAETARLEIGDGESAGLDQRPAGRVEKATPRLKP